MAPPRSWDVLALLPEGPFFVFFQDFLHSSPLVPETVEMVEIVEMVETVATI